MANRQQRRHGTPVANLTVANTPDRLTKGLGGAAGVVVAYPHPVGEVSARFHTSLVDLLVFDSNGAMVTRDGRPTKIGGKGHVTRHGGHMPMSSGANIVTARNKICRAFLEDFPSEPEWLWFIDADMTFEPNILELLLESADANERPIMGGLCFALMKGEAQEIVPTMYGFTSDAMPKMIRYNGYPQDQVVQVVGTGAACLLIHRRVLQTMRDARWGAADTAAWDEKNPGVPFPYPLGTLKYPPPWPFFQETVTGANWGDSMSEDLTFCLRAAQCGFPTHVDTRAKTGHVKPIVIDEEAFFKSLPGEEEPAPTFVTIPVRGKHHLTEAILGQLAEQGGYDRIFVFDNGSDESPVPPLKDWGLDPIAHRINIIPAAGKSIHEMWNAGIRESINTVTRCNVAILNNDLILGDNFLTELANGLRCHPQLIAVCGNYDNRDFPETVQAVQGVAAGREDGTGGFAGFQFMIKGEAFQAGLPMFDEQFEFWYGDNDFLLNIDRAGGVYGIVRDAHVVHIDGGSKTAGDGHNRLATQELRDAVERDRIRFEKKWHLESVLQ
jgi:GT2 family glycosyltransferase